MKKIISGKLYDTDRAFLIGESDHGTGWNDFQYFKESLYVTLNTGEYFLHGEGGPASKYAVSAGQNCWSCGEQFIPLTRKEAMEWAEKNLDADLYIEAFGPVEEA